MEDLQDEIEGWVGDGRAYSTDDEDEDEEQYDDIDAEQPLDFNE